MKLLFDQNISFRIVKEIIKTFPESKQVKELQLENSTDLEIWNFAKKNKFIIVTFDSDFYDISLLRGLPPKIIWLRIGNTSTKNILKVLKTNYNLIKEFAENANYKNIACLEID